MSKYLFLGGPGNISASTAESLLDAGHSLAILTHLSSSNKSKNIIDRAKMYYGDRNNSEALEAAIGEFMPDIIIDYTCYTLEQCKQVTKLACGKTSRYIFVSTVDVYGYPLSRLPMREDDPFRVPNCDYALNKKLCEDMLWEKNDAGNFAVTIVRPAYSMSNRFVLTALTRGGGIQLIPRLRAGKPVLVPGDGTTLIHAGSGYNTGRMIAEIAMSEKSVGKSYNCAHEYFMTHDKYIKLFADAVGVEPNIVHIPSDILNATNNKDIKNSILNDLTRYNIAFSNENFLNDFPNFKWEKSIEQSVREYIEWHDKIGDFASPDEEILEDRIIGEWLKLTGGFTVSSDGIHFNP